MPASQRQQAHPDIWFAQPIEAHQQPMMLPASEAKSFLPTIGLVVLPTFLCAALLVRALFGPAGKTDKGGIDKLVVEDRNRKLADIGGDGCHQSFGEDPFGPLDEQSRKGESRLILIIELLPPAGGAVERPREPP